MSLPEPNNMGQCELNIDLATTVCHVLYGPEMAEDTFWQSPRLSPPFHLCFLLLDHDTSKYQHHSNPITLFCQDPFFYMGEYVMKDSEHAGESCSLLAWADKSMTYGLPSFTIKNGWENHAQSLVNGFFFWGGGICFMSYVYIYI